MIGGIRRSNFVAGMEYAFFASGNSMFCGKGCMLSRFTVMVCVSIAVVGGKSRFLSARPRDLLALRFSP